jgi:hypothetical protein
MMSHPLMEDENVPELTAGPRGADQLIDLLRSEGLSWILNARGMYRPIGASLSPADMAMLAPFFTTEVLQSARITYVPHIENPPFYATLAQLGIDTPLDFTQMAGITFVDTVAISRAVPLATAEWNNLLFHELVHVVQYAVLDTEGFVDRYVRGWVANGLVYRRIPLEVDAYALQARYEAAPNSPFSVVEAVRAQLAHSP